MKKAILCFLTAILALSLIFVLSANAENTLSEESGLLVAENDYVCNARGDVNFDGKVGTADARLILRFAVELQTPSKAQAIAANLDDNAKITVTDARMALRIAVGLDAGASHKKAEEVVMEEASCYNIGRIASKCVYCSELFDLGVIPQKKHTGAGWDIIRESTCTKTGLKEMRCVYCDKLMETEEIPLSSHIYGDIIYKGEKDCTRMRDVYRECKNCGETESFLLLPGAHTYVWTVTTAPTCTDYGIEEMVCKYCDTVMPNTEQHILGFLGHIENWTVVQYPTATEDGLKINICDRCGEELDREILPKTGCDIIEGE